ncbi:MAG: PAS domain-containing protein [Alphaproteobacteria bacterium]|nr:PAS domain-containing protein [Alphaproteobacteria bacterium]
MTSTSPPNSYGSTASETDRSFNRAVEHFLNLVSDAFAMVDAEGRVIRANIAYRRLTGPAGGAHDASIISFVDADRREAVREALKTMSEATPTRALQMRMRIGNQLKLIDAELSWLGESGFIGFVGHDVTREDTLERERLETATARDAVEQVGEIGHWRATRDFKLQCSPGTSRILGLDPTAPPLVLTDFVEMIEAADRNEAVAAARDAVDKCRPLKTMLRIKRPDGATRVLRVSGSPSIDARGQIEAMHGVVVDKTDSHAALNAAMNADSTVRRFVEAAPMSVAMFDRDMRLLMASQDWVAERGVPAEDLLGRSMYDIMPWLPEKWRTVHRQVLRGETLRHERDPYDSGDGRGQGWMKWTCAPWRDANGDIGGLISIHEDVTEIVRAQHEVEASKERMAFGMSMTRMMIWEVDFDAREVYLEGDWTDFFPERPTYDLLTGGETWIHPGDREMFANRWRAHMAGGPPFTAEYRVTLADGRDIWHSASIRVLKTAKGSPARAFAMIQDITARKQVEAKAMEAEQRALVAGAAKSDFLSNMSHEIRTPLNGVLAVSEVLARTTLDEKQSEMVRLITTSGRTLLRVMDDLLEFSRLEGDDIQFDVRPFELEETVRQACETAKVRAEAKDLKFDSFISAGVDGVFRGDAVRIGQVLGNLLNNAVKFTDSGEISVSASVEESDDGQAILHFSVTDTGVGFAPEVAQRIFERFEQADISTSRRYGGLGLGLSIVKRLVDLMSGTVTARSAEGQGSTFEVTIPLTRDRIAALGPLAAVDIEDFDAETMIENLRLLVAEDNPMNRRVVELLLAGSGMEIHFAENGKEAVAKFAERTYDLVLMDLQMPIMGGLAATRAIREWERANDRGHTPILAVSANATTDHVEEAKEAGADDHVAKPIVREVLFEAIARYARPSARKISTLDDITFDLDDLDVAI